MKWVDIRFLVTFIEVSHTRHFGKAAENLYLTSAAVSARIKQVEEYFSVSLFTRHRNNIQLTSAGKKLLPYAIQMAETIKQARNVLSQEDVVHLACAATPNAAKLVFLPALTEIKSKFSQLSLRADILNMELISRQLHEQIIDLAFTTEPVKSNYVDNILLFRQPMYLYCAVHSTTFDPNSYIHIDWGSDISESFFNAYPSAKNSAWKTNALDIAIAYLTQNNGSMLLPEAQGKQLMKDKGLSQILTQSYETLPCYLAVLKTNPHPLVTSLVTHFQLFFNIVEAPKSDAS
ncbi:MAG: DNA-binding transcriptional LysR family regulator [Yoonia sp.]|jgi:DNA-binding transcriptional LysR family regulator